MRGSLAHLAPPAPSMFAASAARVTFPPTQDCSAAGTVRWLPFSSPSLFPRCPSCPATRPDDGERRKKSLILPRWCAWALGLHAAVQQPW